jgi:hypothetical protein
LTPHGITFQKIEEADLKSVGLLFYSKKVPLDKTNWPNVFKFEFVKIYRLKIGIKIKTAPAMSCLTLGLVYANIEVEITFIFCHKYLTGQ